MQVKNHREMYGAELYQIYEWFVGPSKRRKLKALAGLTRYERWEREFGFTLLLMIRTRSALVIKINEGCEESRAAAFEILYLHSQDSHKQKLVDVAFNSHIRYLRERAVGVCAWDVFCRDSSNAISILKSCLPKAVGVERLVLLMHIHAATKKYQMLDDNSFTIDMTQQELSIVHSNTAFSEWADWALIVAFEYEYLYGHIMLHDATLLEYAGLMRVREWCKHFNVSCIAAIKSKSCAEELVNLSIGQAWLSAVEILVLSHYRNDPIPILRHLLEPNSDIHDHISAGEIVASIYKNTSNKNAIEFIEWLTSRFPPMSDEFCFFSGSRSLITGTATSDSSATSV